MSEGKDSAVQTAPAGINVGPEQQALRNVQRIKTLRAAIDAAEKAVGTDQEKPAGWIESRRAELERREVALDELKAALDSV